MQTITNKNDISLEMAVWLLHDEYDHISEANYISATSLMKPIRHIVLPSRVPTELKASPDVEDFIAIALGNSFHAAIEKAWKNNPKWALKKLGYPQEMIDRVLVNPTPEELKSIQNPIPIYIEQRTIREIDGYRVGGKFDQVCDGRVTDAKSTSVRAWIYGGRDDDYRLQGSIYRWLNPDKITEDFMRINYIFTDWNAKDAQMKAEMGYPARRIMHKDIKLLSIQDTEDWIRIKLEQVRQFQNTPESLLPECTEEELWMSEPKFKYYADPSKIGQPGSRSTKNFDSLADANDFMFSKGKGQVVTVPGTPKRCSYCAAFPICKQKDKYTHD